MSIQGALLLLALSFPLYPAFAAPRRNQGAVQGIPRNLGATFSEDAETDARIERALVRALRDLQSGADEHAAFDAKDQRQRRFFYRALARLAGRPGTPPPTLLKAHPTSDGAVLMTLAFGGADDGQLSIEALLELEARATADGTTFCSPFQRHTAHLERTLVGDVTYVHRDPIDADAARGFADFRDGFCRAAGTPAGPLTYYCFPSLDALLRAHGLVFDARRCNFLEHDLGFLDGEAQCFVTGTGDVDRRFEFVRECLEEGPGSELLFRPFATGLAVTFGGYGLSGDRLDELKAQFRGKLAEVPDIDFLREFKKGRASSVHRHFSHFVICAFLAERVLEERGLQAALELARSGPDQATFFAALSKSIGVDEAGLHETVVTMIGG